MSIRLRIRCPEAAHCKYGNTCLVVKDIDNGGHFGAILRLGIANKQQVVQCHSYERKMKNG